MDNENQTNKIDVTYISGDPTLAFQFACFLAQKAYAIEGMNVFKAYPSNSRDFMEDYAGEECILAFGLLDQDMDLYELYRFFSGIYQGEIDDMCFSNCKKMIVTGYKSLSEWYYSSSLEYCDSYMLYSAVNRVYEVNRNESGMVDILEGLCCEEEPPVLCATHKNLDLDKLSMDLLHRSPNGYFEDLSITEHIVVNDDEMRAIQERIEQLTLIDRRKLRAMVDATYYKTISAEVVNNWIDNLDHHGYEPHIHTYKDYGYYLVALNNPEWLSDVFSLYLDYEHIGIDCNVPRSLGKYLNKHITEYGYICGV